MKPLLILGPLLSACAPADEATWRTDTSAVDTDTEINESEEDDEADDGGEDESSPGKWLWGDLEGAEGITGYYYESEDQDVLCEVIYLVESWGPTDDCSACEFAWSIVRGEEFAEVNVDGACEAEGWTGLAGTTIGVGAGADESLWADLGSGWQTVEAEGEAGEEWLFFAISLEE